MVVWVIAIGVLSVAAPKLANNYNNNAQQVPNSADSQVATRLLLQEFPSSRGVPAILVFTDPQGLSATDNARAKQVSDWLNSPQLGTDPPHPQDASGVVSIFTVPQAASQLISQDKTTMTMIVNFPGGANDLQLPASIKTIRAYLQSAIAGTPMHAYLTGPAGISADAVAIFTSGNLDLTLATVVLVLVLLLIVYRSPILALLPIFAVGLVMQVANAFLGFAAHSGWFPVSQQASSIATVLLFGAGTDYCIFIASRYREELRHTQDKHRAMQTTMLAVGEAIASSAGTVVLSLLTLLFAVITLYSSLGPTLAAVVVVMLIGGLTLVPALLAWLGRAAYWPFVPKYDASFDPQTLTAAVPRGFWGRLGTWVAARRSNQIVAVVGSVVFLLILAAGNLGIQRSYNFLTSFRLATDSTTGYNVLQQHFPAGTLAPTTVLLQLHGGSADAYQHLAQIDAITAAIARVPHVVTVDSPTRPAGVAPTIDPATLQAAFNNLPASLKDAIRSGTGNSPTAPGGPVIDPQTAAIIAAYAASTQYISPDNTTVQFSVVFDDDPYALPAIDRIPTLRTAVTNAVNTNQLGATDGPVPNATTTADVHIGGQTSLLADTQAGDNHDTHIIVPAVLLLVALVLALLLRSLVAPLYLLAAVTLNFFAAIGVCSFLFQRIQGQDGIFYAIPLYTFIFLVALGADYTIFLMSRVREEASRRGLAAGVPVAVGNTGGVITSAGLILAGTFAVLTTLPLTLLYQFGVCVAVGVLLDTFVVRGLLVPGLVLLLGRWNWWPGQLRAPDYVASASDPSSETPPTPSLAR